MTVQMEERRRRRRGFSKLFSGFKTQEVEETPAPVQKKPEILKVKVTIE